MAGIDKCYVNSYSDYLEFKEWCKGRCFYTPLGCKIVVDEFLYDWDEDSFEGGQDLPIFNTPTFVDNYLYHNCDIKFIQDWLKSRYLEGGYRKGDPEEITGEMKLREYEPCKKVKILRKGFGNCPYKGTWWVEVYDSDDNAMLYNKEKDRWIFEDDLEDWDSNAYHSTRTVKTIIRKILKKWKLPKGCTVKIAGRYIGDKWILKTK